MRASRSSERVSFFGFRERCTGTDGSKPDETPVARAVSSIIRRARAQTHQFPGKTSLHAAMSGWSFRLSLDRPAVGVARGGDEASLGRGERGPRARLVERADGSGGDEDQEREEAKRPVVGCRRRRLRTSAKIMAMSVFSWFGGEVEKCAYIGTQTDSKIISSYYFKSID